MTSSTQIPHTVIGARSSGNGNRSVTMRAQAGAALVKTSLLRIYVVVGGALGDALGRVLNQGASDRKDI